MISYVYYNGKKLEFDIPSGWNPILNNQEMRSVPVSPDPIGEVKRSLDHPIDSPSLEECARHANQAVILFDDVTRLTPAHLAFPEVVNRLNQGGIPDQQITALCATGTHQPPTPHGLREKLGDEAYQRLFPRVICHDANSRENVLMGRTSRGTPVEINSIVANSDLSIGIGTCSSHSWAGFGGGSKIIMPGISGFQSIAAHHLTWFRNRNTHSGIIKGNLFYEEANEIARMIGFNYKIDFLINFRGEVIKVYSGDVISEHAEAVKESIRLSSVQIPRKADVTITAAFPMEKGNQSIKSLNNAAWVTKSGGTIIWVAPQQDRDNLLHFVREVASNKTANEYHRNLIERKYPETLKAAGLSFMCTVVEIMGMRDRFSIIHVTDGLERSLVESMKMTYASTIQEAIEIAKQALPKGDLIVFPYGGMILPLMPS